jgi:hypothetical protein
MTENKEYRVLITETLQRTVVVGAKSAHAAHRRAEDAWKNAEYLLDAGCFQGVEFHVLGEIDGDEKDKRITRIDAKGGESVE